MNIWGINWIIITLTPLCPSFFFCSAVQLDSCGTQDSGHPEHQDGALRRHEQRGLPLHLGTVSVHFAERLCCFSHPLAQCHYASPEWKSAASLPLLYALVLSWLNTVYRQSVTAPHAFLMQLWCAVGVGVMQFVWHRCGPVGAVSTQHCAAIKKASVVLHCLFQVKHCNQTDFNLVLLPHYHAVALLVCSKDISILSCTWTELTFCKKTKN